MADLTRIAASLAAPSLSSALQQAPDLPLGQSIEAKITQIISDEIIRLTSSFGTFDLRAKHPALQPGVIVRLDISNAGQVTLSMVQTKTGSSASPQAPQSQQPLPSQRAVITTLGKSPATAPVVYSASGQAIPAGQALQAGPGQTPAQVLHAQPAQAPLSQVASVQQPVATSEPQQRTAVTPQVPAENFSPSAQPGRPATAETAAGSLPQTLSSPSVPAPPTTVTPAITTALSAALNLQGSLVPLFASLDQLRQIAKPLPQSLQTAIEKVLQAARLLSQAVTPQTVQQAIERSGVFLESRLAAFATGKGTVSLSQPDLKAALLQLEEALAPLPREVPQKIENAAVSRIAPPRPAEAPEPQPPRKEAAVSVQSTQQEIAGILAKQTEAALARIRVLQFASLPAGADAPDQQVRLGQAWHVDLPLLIAGQAAVIPLQIEREEDENSKKAEIGRRWRVRFALDLAELGAVHALLALGAGMVDVTLWAERQETYDLFKAMTKELQYALLEEELDVAGVEFRAGRPSGAGRAGSNLDTRT